MHTKRLRLIEAGPGDAARVVAVINPSALQNLQFFHSRSSLSVQEERQYLKRMCASGTDHLFLIECRATKALVGSIGFHEHDRHHNTARLGISIFKTSDRGKGYATEAITRLLAFGFAKLRLNKVCLHVFLENKAAQKLYRSLGFKKEGVLREEYQLAPGVYHDMVRMALLKRGWRARFL